MCSYLHSRKPVCRTGGRAHAKLSHSPSFISSFIVYSSWITNLLLDSFWCVVPLYFLLVICQYFDSPYGRKRESVTVFKKQRQTADCSQSPISPWNRRRCRSLSPTSRYLGLLMRAKLGRVQNALPSFARIKRPRGRLVRLNGRHPRFHGKIGGCEQSRQTGFLLCK